MGARKNMKENNVTDAEMMNMLKQEQIFLKPAPKSTKDVFQRETFDTYDKQTLEKFLKLLKELTVNKFFGELMIKYESGHIVQVRKTQRIVLSTQHEG